MNVEIKKIISFFISLSLIFNNFLYALNYSDVNGSNEGYYDINNTMPKTPNAECYFIFDKFVSSKCLELYNKYSGKINEMMKEDTFYKCLISNCGLYKTDSSNIEESYQYKMEVEKKCQLVDENTLNFNELQKSDWFVNLNLNLDKEANVSKKETQTRFLPFKVLKYKCPKFLKIDYQKKERVLQYPVLCFKTDSSLNNTIIKCLEDKDMSACKEVNEKIGGNLKEYIQYLYCDTDSDGDGFPESLSSALQQQCHRADAASLRCEKNSLCSTSVKCVKPGEKTVDSFKYKKCKNLKRDYEDHVVYTQCGDVEDIYQNNPNCVRINSITDARESGVEYFEGNSTTNNLNENFRIIEVKNHPNSKDFLNSYHEYILYQKKNGNVNKRFVALIYPRAIYKETKGLTFLGKILNVVTGGFVAYSQGLSSSMFGPLAIGAGFVTKTDKIPPTVIDDVLRNAIKGKYKVTTNKDVEGITYKVKEDKGTLSTTYKMYMMKAWWDPTVVYSTNLAKDPVADDWIWIGHDRRNIHYDFKFKILPSDVLVMYNINAKYDTVATPEVYYKQYGNLKCSDTVEPVQAEWKKFINATEYKYSSPTIQNMSIFLTYPSLYKFDFYNGAFLVGSFYKNFSYNKGQYPLIGMGLDGNVSGEDFSSVMNNLYSNKYKQLIIDDTVEDYMSLAETKTLINNLTDSLLNTYVKRNIDEILKKEKTLYEYPESKAIFDFYSLDYALDYYISNDLKDNVCFKSYMGDIPKQEGSADLSDDNTLANLNEDLKLYQQCLLSNENEKNKIINKFNNDDNLLDLDKKRLNELMKNTKLVYYDLTQKEKNNINSYLNKSSTRYHLSNDMGSWSMSFKSACGDYNNAKNNAYSNYMSGFNTITKNYFGSEANSIANGLINLIDSHMDNVTLRYRYSIYSRTGTTKWDTYHSAVAGSYSCTYESSCYSSCASTYSCNCSTDKDGNEVCGTCCSPGYVPCTKSESGSCYTYGSAGYRCSGQCNGYVNAHWGSQPNPCGDSECDVSNDWDMQCSANYTYYRTNDNGGNGSGLATEYGNHKFSSYGSYSCDDITLSPTGSPYKYCQTSGHDLKHFNYKNTFTGYGYWNSTAKKLNVSTSKIEELEDKWLRNNNYKDNSYTDSLWATENGYNSIRIKLSTSTTNGIYIETNKYIKPLIKNYVTNLVKSFYKKKIKYELDAGVNGDTKLETNKDKYMKQMYNEAIATLNKSYKFQPFNRVEIHDLLADPDSPYAINYSIKTPSDLLITDPEALNIIMLSFPEVRKYRCYKDFEKCHLADDKNCKLESYFNHNFVNDFTGKRVPTLRDETYKCKSQTKLKTCEKYEVEKKCYNINIGNTFVEFDDKDFSKDFGKAVGESLAFDEAIHIFGAKKYRCEKGLFTDFSWLTDPSYLMQIASLIGGYIADNTSAGKALKSWLKGEESTSDTCSNAWLDCMSKSGSSVTAVLQKGTSAAIECDSTVKGVWGCQGFGGVSNLSKALYAVQNNPLMNNPVAQALQDPLTKLLVQTAFNLAFNTFDNCNQCIDRECAQSHKPEEAVTLIKMTDAKAKKITGAEYGLGKDFIAFGQCFFKSESCVEEFGGHCLRDKEEYCCYNTKIARILAGQIYEQLGLTYQKDGCEAIKITDLPKIDFSPCPDGVIPSPSNKCINYKELEDYINSKINWNLKGSIDMNKIIQAVMDEGADE